jgi:hypothetical protein
VLAGGDGLKRVVSVLAWECWDVDCVNIVAG